MKTLEATPGYQFQLQQGNNAINAADAASGKLASGNNMLDLAKFNQGLAGTTYNNYVSQLQPFLGAAGQSASGIAGVDTGLGSSLNANDVLKGNAAYGANTSIGNANANADLAGLNASANSLGAISGAGTALLGFLSDRRAKDEVEPVGELYDGQTVYRYRYKGDPRHQIGLIAQEVEENEPDAILNFGGLKGVNYKTATDYAARLREFADAA
jgi:Chaperone of endosialidase